MDHNHGAHRSHMWMMILCCAVMLIGLFWGIKSGGFSLGWLMILACPLMHLLMMRGMSGRGDNCHGQRTEVQKQSQ